jgi:hypothetical protein
MKTQNKKEKKGEGKTKGDGGEPPGVEGGGGG